MKFITGHSFACVLQKNKMSGKQLLEKLVYTGKLVNRNHIQSPEKNHFGTKRSTVGTTRIIR